MIFEPPLLILTQFPGKFDLMRLPWSQEAKARILFNSAKFEDLELAEVVIDGMTFFLSSLAPSEITQRFATERFERLCCSPPSPDDSAIGIGTRDNVSSAKHLPEVNHRLLLLGKWIGESLAATAAAWLPSRKLIGFAYFDEVAGQYLAGGPFPGLFQTSFSEDRNGCYTTTGLRYFSGQEVRLRAPPEYSAADTTERLVRIIDDLAINGKIRNPARFRGKVSGETLIFQPSDDLSHVDVIIENSAKDTVPTMM
ncbi:hypothetical protein [Parasphingorhabdus sp.]|uniref:hypothetical protein n=1 Tax=Parasphingorhabdus sp. TaxID=2709688 RepID=UPI003A8D83E5